MFKWVKKLLGGSKSVQEAEKVEGKKQEHYKRETRLRIAHDADVVVECKNAALVMELSQLPSFTDPIVWDEVEVKRDFKKDFKEWKENNAMVFNYMNKVNNVVMFPQAV